MWQRPTPFLFEHSDQAVILLHAYAGSANDVRLLGRALERENYTVYAPQFSGHATGDPRDIVRHGSPAAWWQDTQQAISFMRQKGYTKISIFGLSLGGIFATHALEQDSTLLGGGTFSSPIFPTAKTRVAQMFKTLATRQLTAAGQADAATAVQDLIPAAKAQLQAIDTFTAEQVQAQLSQITQPFFIGQGGQDELIDAQVAQRLRTQLVAQGGQVSFHWYATAGHVITVNGAHHQLENDVLEYLKTIY
ncbi:alpha/beta hydrolase [Lactiplantibacillus fabifermentans]|uniref:Carboxylesterase n=2 Tax=Lactiplantibacillus fabifermentans TaxID=483011 RepID=A0A0R2NKU5_9LACO|nr:alpha/beta fold hydrolase [Lactiplantibacillus fabifermentans]ETY75142.1 carboxylesterase [Lactiplantibacillus fabifermentans T30PCM01]KRO26377.1 carboxylesterase [Lactiplantibacillus fabifermentans DSM 21115]